MYTKTQFAGIIGTTAEGSMNRIYQLYYSNETFDKCNKSCMLIDTRKIVQPFFESYWMNTLPIPDNGYMAVLSPQFKTKTNIDPGRIVRRPLTADLYSPYSMATGQSIWQHGEHSHPGLLKVAETVFKTAGIDARWLNQPTRKIFCNYFIMRASLWRQFRNQILGPVIAACEIHSDIVFAPCKYNPSNPKPSQIVMNATGYPYYTYAPFLCERLIGTWAYQKKLRVKLWMQ